MSVYTGWKYQQLSANFFLLLQIVVLLADLTPLRIRGMGSQS